MLRHNGSLHAFLNCWACIMNFTGTGNRPVYLLAAFLVFVIWPKLIHQKLYRRGGYSFLTSFDYFSMKIQHRHGNCKVNNCIMSPIIHCELHMFGYILSITKWMSSVHCSQINNQLWVFGVKSIPNVEIHCLLVFVMSSRGVACQPSVHFSKKSWFHTAVFQMTHLHCPS